jgi:transposase
MTTNSKSLKIKEPNSVSKANKDSLDNINEKKDLNLENQTKPKIFPRNKLTDLHIVCFKKYIEENRYISPTEAMDRVKKDTGLEIGYSSVQKALLKLKREMGIAKNSERLTAGDAKKLKDTHIELLKSYLIEDKYITLGQAKNRLHEEIGLDVSSKTISLPMNSLREELGLQRVKLNTLGCSGSSTPRKIKDIHIEYLRKYLKEDVHIGNTEAMNRLYQDTGLKVSVTPVRYTLIKLEEEIRNEGGELLPSDSVSRTASKPWVYGLKLKELHIECLKKYIGENSEISNNEATRKLRNETDLKISCTTVGRALAILKNSNQDSIESSLPVSTSKVRCRTGSYNYKLQDQHMEHLKRYISENNSIKLDEAKKKLYNETGLKVSNVAIRNAFLELKVQIDPDQNQLILDNEIRFKQWNFGRKLKDIHIECLKKYLNEDIYIRSTVAKNRLHEETGLEISIYPVQLALTKLKSEMAQDENGSQAPTSKSNAKARVREFGYKVKDVHIECLRKYLKEDEFTHCEVAKERLIQETGLKLCTRYVRNILSKLKTEAESEQ